MKKQDAACVRDSEGKLRNARLHEQMTQGVNDHDLRMESRAKMAARGVPPKVLDSVYPK